MPNTYPSISEDLEDKKSIIETQLQETGIPLHYYLYLGGSKLHFDEIATVKHTAIGLKIFMDELSHDGTLHAAFKIAALNNLTLAVHAHKTTKRPSSSLNNTKQESIYCISARVKS